MFSLLVKDLLPLGDCKFSESFHWHIVWFTKRNASTPSTDFWNLMFLCPTHQTWAHHTQEVVKSNWGKKSHLQQCSTNKVEMLIIICAYWEAWDYLLQRLKRASESSSASRVMQVIDRLVTLGWGGPRECGLKTWLVLLMADGGVAMPEKPSN